MIAMEPVMENRDSDSRRLLIALLAAILLHLCLFAAFAIIRLAEQNVEMSPVSVDLVPGTLPGLPAASSGPGTPAGPAAQAQPAPSATTRSAGRAASSSDQSFVIPTPRQGHDTVSTGQPTGPSFRTSGSRTGAQASSAQPATSPVQVPVFPPSRATDLQGTGATTQGGGGNGSAPSQGVLVQGGGQPAVQGPLDLGSLDKSLAGAKGKPGGGGSAGGGGGTGSGGGGGESLSGGQGDFRFKWDQPEAARTRRLLSSAAPRIPLWVSKEGLTLTVLIAFTLTPDGVLSNVNVEASSGYNEVDAAVSEAIRLWRFNADPSARPIHGLIPYVIRAR